MTKAKKYILAVQGEGRGHMTQAISMYDMLIEQGHTVCAVIVGTSGRREIPAFFFDKIKTKIVQLPSPNFITDKKNKSINITKTLLYNFKELGIYKASLKRIDILMKEHQPDVVINFFDLLIGLYYRYYKPKAKLICIAHQYIYLHSDFEFPNGRMLDRWAIKFFTRITSSRATKKLALSFYNIHTLNDEVIIVPPLLRKEIFELTSRQSDYFLVYLVNNGYYEDIIEWHKANPSIEVHCFTDQPEVLRSNNPYASEKLFLHALNDTLFLEMMSNAKGLASTAGFESVCEAMYLGKPVLMVPVQGHYEQFCNSRDGYKAGAGIFSDKFDLSKLVNFSSTFNTENKFYKDWVLNAKHKIYREISTT
ncbi:MAG: glycosyltransferase [Bacteroidia bacterium]|nr:glycosyltransferase [Bacteroidia bacterium]